jgi:2-phosphosulfolactate phosphatase
MNSIKEDSDLPGKLFRIDCFIQSDSRLLNGYAAVAVDVIRSSTVAVTAVNSGRKCYFAPSVETALVLSKHIDQALLVGEVGGNMPYGFDLNNSPVEIEIHGDLKKPAILVSSSGTPLFHELSKCKYAYVACLRNFSATARYIASHHTHVAIIGAPTRGEFRDEDQICCSRIGSYLITAGFEAENRKSLEIMRRWKDVSVESVAEGKSAEYLRRSGQTKDLEYIINHENDLNLVFGIKKQEIVRIF